LKHDEHSRVCVFRSRSASDSTSEVSVGARNRKYASRDADFGPMPGNCANASISRVTDGGNAWLFGAMVVFERYIKPGIDNPPVIDSSRCAECSCDLTIASLTAATIASSSMPMSFGSTIAGSILMLCRR
jgi:hypothetical protein